ncbi:MAG TPA: type II toxin-antitoxin system VapC family toxin [Legionellaceae bacterium]|nr:type II toxin-antitoxin system VapC family toxin [Legionellaceae bacterium]HVV55985.1 type II toxin-antitoxin system VapC family toxin [Mucilaginibacter sp.]
MGQYLIDTNVVSDYLSASFSAKGTAFLDDIIDAIPHISVITQIELLCWDAGAATEQKVKNFIADSVIMEIDSEVISRCVSLRKGKRIKTPDAIIAATALANEYVLVTGNERDFANIGGLEIINPMRI